MSNHTPGPWEVVGTTTITNSEHSMTIANVSSWSLSDDQLKANAVLISKAPAMYELLQRILYAGEWYTSALEIDRDKDGRILCGEIEELLTQIKEQTK